MPRAHPMPERAVLLAVLKRLKRHDEAAKVFNVSSSTVGQWCKLLKITCDDYGRLRGSRPTLRPSKYRFLKAVDELGHDPAAIGERFGASRCGAVAWFKYFGVDRSFMLHALPEDIPLIMALEGEMSCVEAGRKFDLSSRTISKIWRDRGA